MDLPNKLDHLWVDWDKKTLAEKQAVLKEVVRLEGKVIFSGQDADNVFDHALEVAKALNLYPKTEAAYSTPNKRWKAAHDPDSQRARAQGRKAIADPEFNVPKDGNWWTAQPKKPQQ